MAVCKAKDRIPIYHKYSEYIFSNKRWFTRVSLILFWYISFALIFKILRLIIGPRGHEAQLLYINEILVTVNIVMSTCPKPNIYKQMSFTYILLIWIVGNAPVQQFYKTKPCSGVSIKAVDFTDLH
jgi:hypothetical protein